METIDPATGTALPADAIQRVLFLAANVHVYRIPPMASIKGHNAASWTTDASQEIFKARVRIVETSFDDEGKEDTSAAAAADDDDNDNGGSDQLKVDVVLEDQSTGQLFAAAPYTSPSAVESAIDSSRFFALTVRDPQGRRAVLGIGFEERGEAFDFGVALQEARKALGWDAAGGGEGGGGGSSGGSASGGGVLLGAGQGSLGRSGMDRKDYSLKEGETITVNLAGTKFGRRLKDADRDGSSTSPLSSTTATSGGFGGFSLPPPPSSTQGPLLPPPPPPAGGAGGRGKKRLSQSAEQLGFDDGKFGEFA